MPLQPKYSITESGDATSIRIKTTTGVYNSVNNPGGFGAPNYTIAMVNALSVKIYLPDPNTLEPSSDPNKQFTINLYPILPSTSGGYIDVANTDLGLSVDDKLPDGQYRFEFTMDGSTLALPPVPFTFFTRIEEVFFGQFICCVEKSLATIKDLDGHCAPCRENNYKKILSAMALDGIILNSNCGKPEQALSILKDAQSLCKEGCAGCN